MNVYFVRAGKKGPIKIGKTCNIERRIAEMQTGNAYLLELLFCFECRSESHAAYVEKTLHNFFRKQKIRGEWFTGNINIKKVSDRLPAIMESWNEC